MLKHIYLLLAFALIHHCSIAQDEAAQETSKSRSTVRDRLFIGIGASYSVMELKAAPYTILDSTGRLGYVSAKNRAGINASIHYNIPLHNRFQFRLGIEAHYLRPTLEYDQRLLNKKHSDIFPVEVEIPVVVQFALGSKTNEAGDNSTPYIITGFRPAIPLKQFISLYPTTKSYNLHADFGVGIPLSSNKYRIKLEAVYSLGLINLIGQNEQDFHTASIQTLKRSYAGLRFYFF